MIEPYETVMDALTVKFSELGMTRVKNTEFSMTYSDGITSLELLSERYYHPSLSVTVVDSNGKEKTVRILKRILAPEQANADLMFLQELRSKHDFEHAHYEDIRKNGSLESYIFTLMNQTLDFLISFRNKVFNASASLQAECDAYQKGIH